MKPMTSADAREAFLSFFEEMRHQRVASSSLVPANDPTLLFANSGMVQFKDVFLGQERRAYTRATTAQKCLRVSGKHNDLEEVGRTMRHHTFFEMLGNFSFGDYFKRDAIDFAWALLTKVYRLPTDRLAVTIFERDDESHDLWLAHVPASRIARLGPRSNFWQMAETGPCGPNTEIHWDRAPQRGEDDIIPSLLADDGRFTEIWNLVFMQFNRTQPDPAHTGQYDEPLPAPGVDTGAGLERLLTVLQGVEANYDTDLFTPLIARTQQLSGESDAARDAWRAIDAPNPYWVIADHIRAAVFLIADGVLPGPKNRESVTRLVLRRAARYGQKLGLAQPFLAEVAQVVIDTMGGHYTALAERADTIRHAITQEELLFRRTLDRGLGELDARLDALAASGTLSGDDAFFLKATLGLPIQVTKDVAEERGFTVDMAAFEAAEAQHATASGAGQAMGHISGAGAYADVLAALIAHGALPDTGVGHNPYDPTPTATSVVALLSEGVPVSRVQVGDVVEVVLAATPFYVESGGQVSDSGVIRGDAWEVAVSAMRRPVAGLVVHVGEVVEGTPAVGDAATPTLDAARRSAIIRNHTGTHLLHAALRHQLGAHVQQRGSLVAPERLRFDFQHDARVSPSQLRTLEAEVNQHVLANLPVLTAEKPREAAVAEGAMALFGEKYADVVRTVSIPAPGSGTAVSYELCGGCHVSTTAEIGPFVVVGEGSSSAGVRRIEALTGAAALAYLQERAAEVADVAGALGTVPGQLQPRVEALLAERDAVQRDLDALRRERARAQFDVLLAQVQTVSGVPLLAAQIDGLTPDALRELADQFRSRVPSGVVVLGSITDDKPSLLAAVSDDLTKRGLHAGNIVRALAPSIGGGGGGRPNLAQAGGKDAAGLPAALEGARQWVADNIRPA